jgi:hypothetical protein
VPSPFLIYCMALALTYHEARNVRHLLRNHLIGSNKVWNGLVQLPRNRYDAWRQIQPLLETAMTASTQDQAADIFIAKFGVTLEELKKMFANDNWLHARMYGGNRWARIADLTIALENSLRCADQESSLAIGSELLSASHNTGSLRQKFLELNEATARQQWLI